MAGKSRRCSDWFSGESPSSYTLHGGLRVCCPGNRIGLEVSRIIKRGVKDLHFELYIKIVNSNGVNPMNSHHAQCATLASNDSTVARAATSLLIILCKLLSYLDITRKNLGLCAKF